MAVDCGTDVDFEDVETLSVYNSSEWAERGFCSTCGTHLFYRVKESGQYFIPAGVLDRESDCTLSGQVFIDEKPGYYSFANKTHDMTGAELFEMFASKTD